MSALERVARRIGMEPACELAYPDAWRDGENIVAVDGDLRTYLLTGDRPLRVMAAYWMTVKPCRDVDAWLADGSRYDTEAEDGDTPAAASIALAERIEGEGSE